MKRPPISFMIPIIGIVLSIIAISLISRQFNEGNKLIQEIDSEMKSHVGDTIIVMKDTLLIVDYSIIGEEYILSNGTRISKELAK